jgi:GPI mannosyltransferase 3
MAIALRVWAASPIAQHHSDEFGQYLEQAHRLVFGYGLVPWEYRQEMRSWLLPMLLSVPMHIGAVIAPTTNLYLLLPKIAVALCSMPILWASYALGRTVSRAHGLAALFVAALWYEFVYFAAHILAEPLAVAAILPAIALLQREEAPRRHLLLAGFLLAVGTILRFHYGPVAALIMLGYVWHNGLRRIPFILFGSIAALGCSALVDISQNMVPFEWIWNNVTNNVVLGRAAEFGVSGNFAYFNEISIFWQWAQIPLFICILAGMRHYPFLFWVAVANLILHSFIGHKEYRFIFMSMSIFLILAALGSVNCVNWLAERLGKKANYLAYCALGLGWIAFSASLASSKPIGKTWHQVTATKSLVAQAGKLPNICGIGLEMTEFWTTGAYSVLHRDVPIYLEQSIDPAVLRGGRPLVALPGYNSIVGPSTLKPFLPKDYIALRCLPLGMEADIAAYQSGATAICLYARPGACDARGIGQHGAQQIMQSLNR